jgi:hypothetical protein
VDREEKREQVRRDALAAWNDYQATGLHSTEEETDAWPTKLAAGEDAEALNATFEAWQASALHFDSRYAIELSDERAWD